MTDDNNLWSGESVFCRCGHHVEHHKTDWRVLSVFGDNEPYGFCCFKDKGKGKDTDEEDIECECKGLSLIRQKKRGLSTR